MLDACVILLKYAYIHTNVRTLYIYDIKCRDFVSYIYIYISLHKNHNYNSDTS